MTTSTTIIIPGRETQVIPGLELTKENVIASFAGEIDLSGMTSTESRDEDGVTITFANRTGTKGTDITINIAGDVNIVGTRIEIPGRETQTIPGVSMGRAEVIAAFAGDLDLGTMNCEESLEDDYQVITFSNRTGTKGAVNIGDAIAAALRGTEEVEPEDFEDEEDDYIELSNTRISIPGRETQTIPGIVLDAQMVRESFSGDIDLSGYAVEEVEDGDTLVVTFSARTGTKG